jgi:hypothetical protein
VSASNHNREATVKELVELDKGFHFAKAKALLALVTVASKVSFISAP